MIAREYILYVLIDPLTNEIRYVGQTSMKLNRRLSCHLSKCEKTHKKDWINSLLAKKLKPIIQEVHKYYTQEEINLAEINLIREYKNNGIRLTNLADGGNVTTGYKFTEKQKEKMRGRKPHNLGKVLLDEQKKEISNSLKEFFKNNPKKGINQTIESKRKIGDKNSKKTALIDDLGNIIKIFKSATAAANEFNLKTSSVQYVCSGRRKSVYKKRFKYI